MEDFSIFLGRFHPLIVHLPIGILIMAFILEFASQKTKKFKNILDPAISITLFWGCITSIAAASAGWLISFQGGYDSETLYWHKWLGVSVIVISFISWLIKGRKLQFKRLYTNIILGLVILLLLATGHLGGNLTHGEEYLFLYSPQIIKKMVGMDENPNYINLELSNPDSIKVYKDLIEPIFTELPGWDEDLMQMTSEDAFPQSFKDYISFIEAEVGVPITLVSVGPDRAQTIIRD